MPELPEVETVRVRIEPILVGRRFDRVEILDPRLTRPHDPVVVAAELRGERVRAVERRGKYVVVRFESGRVLLIHLRMTGSLLRARPGEELSIPHARAVVSLDNNWSIVYRDVRRFGTWLLLEPDEVAPYLDARVGQEPLERPFGPRVLERAFTGRRAPLKAALLDQRVVAGLGNIYVDEALWRAKLHPLRVAHSLDGAERATLARAIRAALRAGLARQGATLRDYRLPDGGSGSMQDEFRVYGRAGEPCSRCGTPIEKIRVGGRGTWYCPSCQVPEGAARPDAQDGSPAAARSS